MMKQTPRVPSPSHNHHHHHPARASHLRYTRRCSAVNYSKCNQNMYLPPQQSSKTQQQSYRKQPHNNPSFEKDFGPFSAITERSLNKDGSSDISSMFNRRNQQDYQVESTSARMSGGFKVEESRSDQQSINGVWSSKENNLSATTVPSANATTARRSYGLRYDELDKILAKYGKEMKDEEVVVVEKPCSTTLESGSTNLRPPNQPGIHSGYWDVHPGDLATGRRRNPPEIAPNSVDSLNNNPLPSTETKVCIPQPEEELVLRRSTHVFPYKETSNGLLVVEPAQIAFESRKVSVLVADPNNNCSLNDNVGSKHEKILQEVRKAMSIAVESSPDGLKKVNSHNKELVQRKYSDSKKATEEFERGVLQRFVSGKNADTHVMIGDKIFPCHGVALEVFSSYFDRVGREKEAIQKVQLSENEVSQLAFQTIMSWLFQSDENRKLLISKDNLVQVYAASKHLGIKDLEHQCIAFVEKKVEYTDPDLLNIWEGLKSKQNSCPDLVRIIMSKMAASYSDIYASKKYLNMDVDELHMLLSNDDVAIESEMDVYNSAVSWLLHDWKSRKIHTNKLMSTVRFGLLTPLQLTQINLCPEINKFKCEKDYNQVLAFGTVKSMIDDGLSYSILVESYKDQPEELQRWVDKTGVRSPGQRTALVSKKLNPFIQEKISLLEDASQTKLTCPRVNPAAGMLKRTSSYTLVDQNKEQTNIITSSSSFHTENDDETNGT